MAKYCRNQSQASQPIGSAEMRVDSISSSKAQVTRLVAGNQRLAKELQEARIEIEALKLVAGGK